MKDKLDQQFYENSTLLVAKKLLGKYLVHKTENDIFVGRIVETEAYLGFKDLASHAAKGKTIRNKIMFGPAGFAYIYLIYGMYYCFNVVTEKQDFPSAVLIRALEPIKPSVDKFNNMFGTSDLRPASGPGKLCRYLHIEKYLNNASLLDENFYIEDRGGKIYRKDIVADKRIGIDYAKHCKNFKWRFYIKNNIYVSKN